MFQRGRVAFTLNLRCDFKASRSSSHSPLARREGIRDFETPFSPTYVLRYIMCMTEAAIRTSVGFYTSLSHLHTPHLGHEGQSATRIMLQLSFAEIQLSYTLIFQHVKTLT